MNTARTSRRRTCGVLLSTLAVGAGLVACSSRAPADMIGLYYTGGTGENRAFQECIEPSGSGSFPVDDSTFWLPTSLRTWTIAVQAGDSQTPITTGSQPVALLDAAGKPSGRTQAGPEMNVWATATFFLNTDCEGGRSSPIVQFWEKTGKRPWANGHGVAEDGDDGDGFREDAWRAMLQNTLVQAEAKAIRQESRNYVADDIDANNSNVWTLIERALGPSFNQALHDAVGGDYFCGPQFHRNPDTNKIDEAEWTEYASDGVDDKGLPRFREVKKRGKCPPVQISITDAGFTNADVARSRSDVYAAEQRAKAALIDAQSKADVAAKLEQVGSSSAYLELQRVQAQLEAAQACRTNPNCTIIIDGTGGGVTVGAGRR